MLTKRVVKPPKRFITEFETEFKSETEEMTPVKKKYAKVSKNEDGPISTAESEPASFDEIIDSFKNERGSDSPEEIKEKIKMKMKKPFECKKCDDFFDDRKKLKKHVNHVHDKKKFYKCDLCDATFSKKFNIKFHISSVHE